MEATATTPPTWRDRLFPIVQINPGLDTNEIADRAGEPRGQVSAALQGLTSGKHPALRRQLGKSSAGRLIARWWTVEAWELRGQTPAPRDAVADQAVNAGGDAVDDPMTREAPRSTVSEVAAEPTPPLEVPVRPIGPSPETTPGATTALQVENARLVGERDAARAQAVAAEARAAELDHELLDVDLALGLDLNGTRLVSIAAGVRAERIQGLTASRNEEQTTHGHTASELQTALRERDRALARERESDEACIRAREDIQAALADPPDPRVSLAQAVERVRLRREAVGRLHNQEKAELRATIAAHERANGDLFARLGLPDDVSVDVLNRHVDALKTRAPGHERNEAQAVLRNLAGALGCEPTREAMVDALGKERRARPDLRDLNDSLLSDDHGRSMALVPALGSLVSRSKILDEIAAIFADDVEALHVQDLPPMVRDAHDAAQLFDRVAATLRKVTDWRPGTSIPITDVPELADWVVGERTHDSGLVTSVLKVLHCDADELVEAVRVLVNQADSRPGAPAAPSPLLAALLGHIHEAYATGDVEGGMRRMVADVLQDAARTAGGARA